MIRIARTNRPSRLTRTLVSAGLGAAAGLALVAVPVTGADAAPLKCTTPSCILDLTVHADGLSMNVSLHTGPATTAGLAVYQGDTLVSQVFDKTLGTAHSLTTAATLVPNTTYTWYARATDKRGHFVNRTGVVSTLHRRVTVQFLTDTVTNDSDSSSAGDFATAVAIPGQRMIPPLLPHSINTGETKLMGAVLVQRDAGPTTPIYTEMYDDDSPFSGWYPNLSAFTFDDGTDELSDWATAKGTINTTAATPGLMPFQTSTNSYVGFIVRGYYSVDFVS